MTNKEAYRLHFDKIPNLPVFFTPWYLDSTCGKDHWNVAISYRGTDRSGIMPYFRSKKFGISHITMPLLLPYLGPWIIYPSQKQKKVTQLGYEKKVIGELISQLPNDTLIKMHCHPELKNILPAHWSGFDLKVRYTFQHQSSSEEEIMQAIDVKQRNIIQKNKDQFEIVASDDIDLFWTLNKSSFRKNNSPIPYTKDYLTRLYNAVKLNEAGKLHFAVKDGKTHCGILTVKDQKCTYCLAIGNDPNHKNSGALSVLMYHAIVEALKETEYFNFEGGMIPNIEKFFRSFGGELTPYYRIEKARNQFLKGLLNWMGKI